MDQNTIIFRMGEETGIVIEKTKEQFEHSLFKEQYRQALGLVNDIVSTSSNDFDAPISNVIAFCGDRGEGKTSALMTVRDILKGDSFSDEVKDFFPVYGNHIEKDSFRVLNLIDPAFFDNKHNLLELLLGQMYADIVHDDEEKEGEYKCNDTYYNQNIVKRNRLMQLFDAVRRSLAVINKASDKSAYDNLEEIDELATGISLKEKFNELLLNYAEYFQKKRVLICIDDLDLNIAEGYTMAEEIRKYLSSPQSCIVLMAIKIEQMEYVIKSYLRKRIDKIVTNDEINDMATRYVIKLIPDSHRINMPQGESIVEKKVVLEAPQLQKDYKEEYLSIKEAVVRLIYKKTGYIFINGRNISPIVPLNLRSVRLLLGLLWKMSNSRRDDGTDNLRNKEDFKAYFYSAWIANLSKNNLDFVEALIHNEDIVSINKDVITHLGNIVLTRSEKEKIEISDNIVRAILHPYNAMQNISTGDVFYIINYVENVNSSAETKYLICFLRAFYSMKMYETYNVISESEEKLFPNAESEVSIYKYDAKIQKQNQLQRLINGSYFTYEAGALMPKDKRHQPRDKRIINGKALISLFKNLSFSTSDMDWQLCEFFALTTTYPIYADKNVDFDRTLTNRSYIDPFSDNNNYIVFDVLSIFYNIINIKQTYQRWNTLYSGGKSDFYKDSLIRKESLLNQMIAKCNENHYIEESNLNHNLHCFISEAIIRFSEVQMSIMDNLINKRDTAKTGGNLFNISNTYNYICDLGIKLYPIKDEKDSYNMKFWFLEPIKEFLYSEKTPLSEENFNSIYQFDVTIKSIRKMIEDVFGKTILSKRHKNLTGKEIRDIIEKQDYADLYDQVSWDALFDENIEYTREDIISILSDESIFSSVRQISRSIIERERVANRTAEKMIREINKIQKNSIENGIQEVIEPLKKQVSDLTSKVNEIQLSIEKEDKNGDIIEIERLERDADKPNIQQPD